MQWGDQSTKNSLLSKGSNPKKYFHVGTATDNTVQHSAANSGLGDCGTAPTGQPASGAWGTISHTYAQAGTYTACVVIYDVHYSKQNLTTLSAAITSTQGNLPVASAAKISDGEVLVIDSEQMLVTGVIGNSVFVTRHVNGTSAASHKAGAAVNGIVLASPKELVAGSNSTPYRADDHNSDNSAETNDLKSGKAQCLSTTFTVKQPTTLTSRPGATVNFGDGNKLTDSATLSGGVNPGGTITFYLFAPGITPATDFSNNVYSDVVTVSGNGAYSVSTGNNPGGYLPPAAGTYQWVAVYSGDSFNGGSQDGSAGEQEIVNPGASIGNFVWEDVNGNGVQDAGEPGIAGVTLTLTGTKAGGGSITDHATTDASGHYAFSETPGTYTVAVDTSNFVPTGALTGYTATPTGKGTTATDSNPSPSGTTPAALPSGGSDQTIDFGYYRPAVIGNFVWNDLNGNGVQDASEPGINGVTLTLTGTSGAGTSVIDHATTTVNGGYFFEEAPGTYTVRVDASNFSAGGALQPYDATPTLRGGNAFVDSNPNPSGTTPATLASNGTDLSVDFGYFQLVRTGNFVWDDLNGNGVQDAGEPGINGVTLTLTGTTGSGSSVTDHSVTAGNGGYQFTEAPGTYTVSVDAGNFLAGGALAGYTATPTGQGTSATDSNPDPSGTTPAALASAALDLTVDFGFYRPVQIGDFIWHDHNGTQEPGEPGIPGVTVTLTGTNGAGGSVTDHATTDPTGHYLFTEAPGSYTVAVDASNFAVGGTLYGYVPSPTLVPPNPALDSNPNPSGTTPAALPSGGTDLTIDFGYNAPPVAANDAYTTLEDTGLIVAGPGVLGNDTDADSDPLTAVLVSPPSHGSLTFNSDGSFSYTPAANFNGLDSFTYKANDGAAASNTATVMLTVTAVNDAPSFDLPATPNQSVVQDSGAQTVAGFATNISAGPANESSQTLTFHTSNDDNSLFSAQPHIDESSGDLTYTPATGQTGTATVSVFLTDNGGTANGGVDTSVTKTFTITVHPPNLPPTDITLTPSSIPENSGPNATVGTLTSTDPDVGDTHTYSLVTGTGDTDNGAFTIGGVNGDQLIATNSFDFETKSSYSVRVQTDDGHGNTFAKALTVTVTNVNEAPTDITLSSNSIAENSGANAVIGTLGAVDPDTGETYTFSLANTGCGGGPFADNASFNISGSSLRENASFDFETKNSYSICVHVADGSNSFDKTFTISVTNVDEAPTDITLSNNSIAENSGTNAFIGTLGATDPDTGETYSFSLEGAGCGGGPFADNGSFNIAGSSLRENASLDFETQNSYSICVRVTDGPNTFDKTFTISVTNVNEPPTDISLSNDNIDENKPVGSLVGNLSPLGDPDSGETYTYTLLTVGCSSTFLASSDFQISGSQLQGAVSFDYEARNSFTICVRVNDPGSPNLSFERTFTISINDVNDAPVAVADSYSGAIGNTVATVQTTASGPHVTLTGNSLIANDTDEDNPSGTFAHALSAVPETVATTGGGTAQINSDGSFVYTPGVGDKNQDDTFTYHVTDGSLTSAGTATIHIDNFLVWYVDNSSTGTHDGRSSSPFLGLSSLNAAGGSGDSDGPGDYIFLYYGTGASYGGGIPLEANQSLWGQKQGLTVDGDTLVAAGSNAPTITNSGGVGVGLANGSDVEGLNISGTSGDAVNGSAVTTSTVGTSTAVNISSAGGDGVDLSGAASGNISIASPITGSAGHSVAVSGRSGGTVAFSGSINDSGTGVSLSGNTGATINLTGGVVASTGASTAFSATGGGTVNVTGATNTLTTTTGTALNVTSTNIGASGLTFRSISAGAGGTGPASGIVLNGTGSAGGLTITGGGSTANGGDASGGTIQHTTARGIQLTNTHSVSLNNVKVDTTGDAGIGGSGVHDFTLTNSTVSNNGSNGTSLDSNVDFGTATGGTPTDDNVDGVVTITNNLLTNAHEHGIDIQNYSGTISNATISNNTLTSATSAASSFGSGIRLLGFGSASGTSNITKATISNNAINNFPAGAGITAQFGNSAGAGGTWGTPNNATNLITISGNTITGFSAAAPVNTNAVLATLAGNGQAHWKIDNNTASLVGGTYIGVSVAGVAPVAQADITNNHLTGMVSSNAQTIVMDVDFLSASTDHPTLSGTISGNTISGQDGEGIQALATSGSSGSLSVSILNNSITAPNCSGCNRFGMTFNAGLSATVTGAPSLCAKVSGNTSAGSGVDTGIGFRKRTGATLNIDSFPSPGTDPTSYLTGLNPLGGGVTNITSSTAGSCTAP